jgi:hypothetical protein
MQDNNSMTIRKMLLQGIRAASMGMTEIFIDLKIKNIQKKILQLLLLLLEHREILIIITMRLSAH